MCDPVTQDTQRLELGELARRVKDPGISESSSIGGLALVTVPGALSRLTPETSLQKERSPVPPQSTGLAAIDHQLLPTP